MCVVPSRTRPDRHDIGCTSVEKLLGRYRPICRFRYLKERNCAQANFSTTSDKTSSEIMSGKIVASRPLPHFSELSPFFFKTNSKLLKRNDRVLYLAGIT